MIAEGYVVRVKVGDDKWRWLSGSGRYSFIPLVYTLGGAKSAAGKHRKGARWYPNGTTVTTEIIPVRIEQTTDVETIVDIAVSTR